MKRRSTEKLEQKSFLSFHFSVLSFNFVVFCSIKFFLPSRLSFMCVLYFEF